MTQFARFHRMSRHMGAGLAALALLLAACCGAAAAAELSESDFKFDGPLGSHGAQVERVGPNHFHVTLGNAPEQPTWCNMLYFQITGNAKGNTLRVDVSFPGGDRYRFNHNSATWSYDAENWQPIRWVNPVEPEKRGDSLLFPEFTENQVWFGAQVPMSYENVVELMERWGKHPHAAVHVLGKSLGGRNLYRLEITDPDSPVTPAERWVHWIGNQHPGEHNSQWRMVGMVDWLLSDEGADCRRRSISHFVLMNSPDGPSNGWYRVNAQGIDMNRSYFPEGADEAEQAHEAYIVQKDLEELMASDAPVTNLWSMHTWGGLVEPIMVCGPEMGTVLKPWEDFRRIMQENDPQGLIKPLAVREKPGGGGHWNNGPHVQFGITTVLCEGSGDWTSKQRSLDAGAALMKTLADYYHGTRPAEK